MQKRFQSNQRSSNSIKLALSTLALLLVIIILSKTFGFIIFLGHPLNFDTNRQYSWDGRSSLNLAVLTQNPQKSDLAILSLNPKTQRAVVFNIPEQTYLEVPKSFGWWQMGSVYKLGQENSTNGGFLIKLAASKLLGLPIDGVIIIKNTQASGQFLQTLHKNPLSVLALFQDIQSDLTLPELIKVVTKFSSVRNDKFSSIDLYSSDITQSKLLPDSSRVLGVDEVKLDLYIRDKMADSHFLDEGKTVAIYNSTKHSGLAQEAARMVTNMGGNVIVVTNSDNQVEDSVVILQQKMGETPARLTQIFAPQCLHQKCETQDQKVLNSRAQISIVLGEDYYKLWHER